MGTYSGYTSETAKSLLLDAGAFFKNFYVGTDTFASAVTAGKLLGATSGGGSFNAVPTMRNIEIDGIKGEAKGLKVLDSWDVGLSANVKEIKKATIQAALATSEVDTATSSDYDIIQAKNEIALTDYIDNITWIGNLSGTNKPVIIQIYNALNGNGLSVDFADKDEAVLGMEFKGHYTDTNLDNPPFKIYYPKAITNTVDSDTHTFSKAAPADIVLTITSSDDAECGAVKIDGEYVIETGFTLGSGTVTLEKEYLAELDSAGYVFTLVMDKGNNIDVTVTVGA